MIPTHYKERYKRILHKDKITKKELEEFVDMANRFTRMFPNWKKDQIL